MTNVSRVLAEPPEDRGLESKRIADLLCRYPNLSDPERAGLIADFRRLSNLDIAFMLSDPDVAPNLERFRRENKRETAEPFRNYALLIAIAIAGIAATVYAIMIVT